MEAAKERRSSSLLPPSLHQARSQKFAMGWGAVLGSGKSPQPLEANGGLGAKPLPAGGWGFGGKALENYVFFCKNNFILGLFWLKINAFKT